MKTIRIIPRLDIKGPNVVKGIHLEGLRVLGKPKDFAQYYFENGADEIIYMDVVASLYGRNSLLELIRETTENIFIPIAVGGGLRSVEDINNILRAGADKAIINTAAIKDPSFIKRAVEKFGSSTIVVAIEAIKNDFNQYFAFIDNGREYTGIEVVEWAQKVEELGAGEIVITSVDQEGTGKGYDINLITKIKKNVSIPVVAHGGAGKLEHLNELFTSSNLEGVVLASILHYNAYKIFSYNSEDFKEGNLSFLMNKNKKISIDTYSINEIKEFLSKMNYNVRY